MAEKLGASLTILREREVEAMGQQTIARHRLTNHMNRPLEKSRKVVEVLVRKVPDDQQTIELRIAVLGNVEVGKSTLLGNPIRLLWLLYFITCYVIFRCSYSGRT